MAALPLPLAQGGPGRRLSSAQGIFASKVHIVNVVSHGVTLARRRVLEKSNESAIFPEVLDDLRRRRRLSGDAIASGAMGCP